MAADGQPGLPDRRVEVGFRTTGAMETPGAAPGEQKEAQGEPVVPLLFSGPLAHPFAQQR